ncbi:MULTISPECIES: hypothetical protein [Sphingomonas]|uniref:hypothetical protein n=1 Tax=Sphingomonas TaxID=13687 RepID=UPI001269CD86|nr:MULTISPECIES: hypothetical protein [Sphingomonas]
MFISWGVRSKAAHVGDAGVRHCERCGEDSNFQHWVTYQVRHAYWLFRWVTGKETQLVCGHCGAQHWGDDTLDKATVAKAIPFLDRRGWTLGAGALASLFAVGAVASAADASDNANYVAAPRVGDIYEVDAARLSSNPEAPVMYSTIRVAAIAGDTLTLQPAKTYFKERRGADRDLSDGTARSPDYYADVRDTADRHQVAQWLKDGIIVDVER